MKLFQAYGCFLLFQEIIARRVTQRFEPFQESIKAFEHCAALTQHVVARQLATQCLAILGVEPPNKLVAPVHSWDKTGVATWMNIHGFADFENVSMASSVDGKMLLLLTEDDLINVFQMTNKFHRKQFLLCLSKEYFKFIFGSARNSEFSRILGVTSLSVAMFVLFCGSVTMSISR